MRELAEHIWVYGERLMGGKIKKRIDIGLLAVFYLLPLLGVIKESCFALVSLLLLVLIAYFAFTEHFFSLYPLLFFFYEYLVGPGNIVVYRAYTLVFIARFAFLAVLTFLRGGKLYFSIPRSALLLSLFLCLAVGASGGWISPLGSVIDLVFTFCYFSGMREESGEERRYSEFCVFFVIAAMLSAVSGFFLGDAISSLLVGGIDDRYTATLEDPNYLGFYLNVAIAIVLLHPFFKNLLLKLPCLAVLYVALVASASITGILCNAVTLLFCFVCLIIMRKMDMKKLGSVLLCGAGAGTLCVIATKKSWGSFSQTALRILEKAENVIVGDLSELTTNRVDLWQRHLRLYFEQPYVNQLFGGTFSSALGVNKDIFKYATHQEFISVMLTLGLVGLAFYSVFLVSAIAEDVRRNTVSKENACIRLSMNVIWLVYACATTLLLNTRFYILFFL